MKPTPCTPISSPFLRRLPPKPKPKPPGKYATLLLRLLPAGPDPAPHRAYQGPISSHTYEPKRQRVGGGFPYKEEYLPTGQCTLTFHLVLPRGRGAYKSLRELLDAATGFQAGPPTTYLDLCLLDPQGQLFSWRLLLVCGFTVNRFGPSARLTLEAYELPEKK